MATRILSSLEQAPMLFWDEAPTYPFLSRAFLSALEQTGAVGPGTGWAPHHLLLEAEGRPLALLPLYRKSHSRGEYVFDHAWAEAYQRYGLRYYPKLLSAIPFTPVTGPRCLLAPGVTLADCGPALLAALKEETAALGASSWHGLFLPEDWQALCREQGLALRSGCQFFWTDATYGDFEGFLASFSSKRRKTLRRERRRVEEQGIACRWLEGAEIDSTTWAFFYDCYARTYALRGQHPYLGQAFFEQLGQSMPERLALVLAESATGPVACALFFKDADTLYGRYWGATEDIDCLHFEVCYYQGIDYCLRQGLQRFDPGTQGEHKLTRGFSPTLTYSAHWMAEPAFQEAIERFVQEEEDYVRRYQQDAKDYLPFRQGDAEQ